MELLLWRWSVGVQGTSLALILVFFAVLARTLRFPELTSWAQAWAANFIALGVTFLYWNWRTSDEHFPVLAGVYMAAKTAFALLLILGALQLRRPGVTLVSKKTLLGFAAVYGAAGLLVPTIDVVGIIRTSSWAPCSGSAARFSCAHRAKEAPRGWVRPCSCARSCTSWWRASSW
jgi:hypothetical protein